MSSNSDYSENQDFLIDITEKLIEKFSQHEISIKQSDKRNPYVYKDGPLSLKRKRWTQTTNAIQFVAGSEDDGAEGDTIKLSKTKKEDTVEGKKPSIPMEAILLRLGSMNIETDEYHLYSINIKLISPKIDECQQKVVSTIIPPDSSSHVFGVVTPNRISTIPSFPVYTKSGEEMEVTISLCNDNVRFRNEEWAMVLNFHDFIIRSFLKAVEFPMMFSPNNAESSMLLVPLIRSERENRDHVINWCLLKKIKENKTPRLSKDDTYVDKVIIPKYVKHKLTQYCSVVRVCTDLNPTSSFPSDRFDNFCDYYIQEFGKEIQDPKQPLLETILLSEPLNAIKRRDENRRGVAFQNMKEQKNFTVYNVPELCDIHPMPASLLKQSFYIPSILYRIISLLVADELREAIAKGINEILDHKNAIRLKLNENEVWEPLIFERTLQNTEGEDVQANMKFDHQPDLKDIQGPSPGIILRCLTAAQAQDAFDVER